jgi:hypothetical protein
LVLFARDGTILNRFWLTHGYYFTQRHSEVAV